MIDPTAGMDREYAEKLAAFLMETLWAADKLMRSQGDMPRLKARQWIERQLATPVPPDPLCDCGHSLADHESGTVNEFGPSDSPCHTCSCLYFKPPAATTGDDAPPSEFGSALDYWDAQPPA